MKVLYVINSLDTGGAQRLIVDLVLNLKKNYKDVEPAICVLKDCDSNFKEIVIKEKIPLYVSSKKSVFDIGIFKKLNRLSKDFDIIHANLFPSLYWCAVIKRNKKNRTLHKVYTEHSTFNRRRKYKFFVPFERWFYGKYDAITAISEKTSTALVEFLGEKYIKPIVIENGVDIEKYKLPKVSHKTFNVCMVSRFQSAKDQLTVIKAMSFLPEYVHCYFAGEGDNKRNCIDFAQKENLSNRCHFLGNVFDVAKLLCSMDVMVQSSFWEGFGLTVIEGMAAGLPVIATCVEGMKEIVEDYGLLFDIGDFEGLSCLIKKLINDKQFYDEVAKKCFQRSKEYSIQKMVQKYHKLYEDIL